MEQVVKAGDAILRLEAFLRVVEGLAGNTVSCLEDNLACYALVYKLQFLRTHKAAAQADMLLNKSTPPHLLSQLSTLPSRGLN